MKPVKVLGAFAILDEGETDWKVLVVDVRDALAAKVNDIGDVEAYMPGFLEMMKWWFRMYKVPDGKKENELASEGNIFGREYVSHLPSLVSYFITRKNLMSTIPVSPWSSSKTATKAGRP